MKEFHFWLLWVVVKPCISLYAHKYSPVCSCKAMFSNMLPYSPMAKCALICLHMHLWACMCPKAMCLNAGQNECTSPMAIYSPIHPACTPPYASLAMYAPIQPHGHVCPKTPLYVYFYIFFYSNAHVYSLYTPCACMPHMPLCASTCPYGNVHAIVLLIVMYTHICPQAPLWTCMP